MARNFLAAFAFLQRFFNIIKKASKGTRLKGAKQFSLSHLLETVYLCGFSINYIVLYYINKYLIRQDLLFFKLLFALQQSSESHTGKPNIKVPESCVLSM